MILAALEHYSTLNQEALDCKNGEKVPKPTWKVAEEEAQRLEYEAKKQAAE